jgi:alpha-beta hydrolase superfamily lysophospholipase
LSARSGGLDRSGRFTRPITATTGVSRRFRICTRSNLQVRSGGGIVPDGGFFRGERPALVVLASGYGDTQDQMLSIAESLHRAGFDVITYNSRARATSGGEYVTLGVREQRDLVSLY